MGFIHSYKMYYPLLKNIVDLRDFFFRNGHHSVLNPTLNDQRRENNVAVHHETTQVIIGISSVLS